MTPSDRAFLYGKQQAAVFALIGGTGSALWTWAMASGQDYITFEGTSAKGAFVIFWLCQH